MHLTFAKTHLSISSFPPTALPDFTLITGLNGAGKSHLLRALQNGSVLTDIANPNTPAQEIRFFDWSTLVPQDSGPFTSESLKHETESLRNQLTSLKQHEQAAEPIRSISRRLGFPNRYVENPYELSSLSKDQLRALSPDGHDIEALSSEIQQAASVASNWILSQLDPDSQNLLMYAAAEKGIPVALMSSRDISSAIPKWGRTDLFQQSFGRLFVAYRDAKLSNDIAQFRASKGDGKEDFLSDEEFVSKNGAPPWDFVNRIIAQAGLGFTINSPEPHAFSVYAPQLTKNSTGVIIPFSNLSSGEKVLMSFAFCVYYANDRRQLTTYPKLLLFDEIDAPLHPSMTKSLVDTITSTLVDSFGIKVIMTTHSPSTVALSPDSAIHLMVPDTPGVTKVGKSAALNILTAGVPTLSISFDGRRQVFVESTADAKNYDELYKVFKASLASERSLEFIATGTKSLGGGEINSGCDVVKRLVEQLVKSGNQSVFGLIDHDGHHKSEGRLVVLGNGTRNGLENFLLDPLLIAALICRDYPNQRSLIGMNTDFNWRQFLTFPLMDMQLFVDNICSTVLGGVGSTTASSYFGGFDLYIDQRWMAQDDHRLEDMVLAAYPFLKATTKNKAGRMMLRVINTVITDAPELAPAELVETLRDLLNREAHMEDV